jgi:hypothetical protein
VEVELDGLGWHNASTKLFFLMINTSSQALFSALRQAQALQHSHGILSMC